MILNCSSPGVFCNIILEFICQNTTRILDVFMCYSGKYTYPVLL